MSEFLKEGYYVKIGAEYYKISAIEPFNYKTGESTTAEFTVISTAANSGFKDITVLEPSESPPRLYQVRAGIRDGADYWFKIPTGTNRFGVDDDKDVGYLDHEKSPYFDKNEDYEFYLINDYYPSIQASNATGISVTPAVYFEGMKYDLERVSLEERARLDRKDLPYRIVTLGGVKVSE